MSKVNAKKVYIFLANGFEEVEAVTPIDYLRRVNDIQVVTVGVTSKIITGGHNIAITTDMQIDDGEFLDGDAIILPGGLGGVNNLKSNKKIINILKYFYEHNRLICAICAAPSILGELGYLKDKTATCYPKFLNDYTVSNITENAVEVDGNIITALACGTSAEFSYAIIEKLINKDAVQALKEKIYDKKEYK